MDIQIINRGFMIIKSKIRNMELEAIKKNNLDISDVQWNYLVWVVENNNMKMGELCKMLGVQKGTLSNNVKYLLSKKLITKSNNGRLIRIEPTKKGNKYIEIHNKTHTLIKKEMNKILSDNEIDILTNIGIKLREKL